ncbi:ABC transporter substrate-binding protein [Paraneptunicella aestuarii]|uniref:ABC transporter substrate-binding protein n=1 Tax=Paraneptunicella aestuarii TaxID=2831148 RepID=UPI001E48792C|nr:ABC transporter substrate-binding protein [Paraneptunicella aestuarii]UAA38024.1 ABC transporter substrate-binding protein [Paraneptunicella aestuarii]
MDQDRLSMVRLSIDRSVNIAVCGPLTGPRSAYGDMLKAECEHLRQANVHLQHFDDMANPEQAIAVAKTVIAEQFDVVIGHFNSYCSLAVKNLYREAKIGFISPLSTNPELTLEQGGALFCPSDDDQLQALVSEAEKAGKRIYVFHDGSPYSKNLISQLGQRFPEERILNAFEQFPTEAAGDSMVFLAGAHCNLVQPHIALRKAYPTLKIVGCDDCYIDEYFDDLAHVANQHDFVMGQAKGHEGNLRNAVQYLNDVIHSIPKDTPFFNVIGQNTANYQFNANGRVASAVWQLLPLQSLVKP